MSASHTPRQWIHVGVIFALLLGLAAQAMPVQAAGVNYYVSPSGNNGNDCLTPGSACLTIQGAVDKAGNDDIIHVAPGTYANPVNIQGRSGISIIGDDTATVIIRPTSTLPWNYFGHTTGRQTVFRVADSTNITLSNMTMDFSVIRGNNRYGIFYANSTGTVANNVLENMSISDASGGYYEICSYFRALAPYTDASRANITISNNDFIDCGRVAIVTHDYIDATIDGNTFYKTFADFGYAIELGSVSTGSITNNTIYGYDTAAASDGSTSAGIYIENAFTSGYPATTKDVTISGNEIYDCQEGITIGNQFNGYAGNVDIVVTLTGNDIHDNLDLGVLITDEDAAAGSSVTVNASNNTLTNNGDAGYFIYTIGDGNITANISDDTISGNDIGVYMNDYDPSPPTGSTYAVTLYHNSVTGNGTAGVQNDYTGSIVDATDNWWGCPEGPGNPGCDPALGGIAVDPSSPCTDPTCSNTRYEICPPIPVGGSSYSNLDWTVTVPEGAEECFYLSVVNSAEGPLPNPTGLSLLGHRVTIDIMRSDGSYLTDFIPPLGVCFTYSAADLATVGGDPSQFTIWTAPLGATAWEALPTTLYTAQSRVCVQAAHLSDFALFGRPAPATGLPATGFAPGQVTLLPQQPEALAYGDLGDLWLEIPRLGVQTAIVGVPASGGNWDVSWLGGQAGWLEGSAFPTLTGNSAITGHVYDANGQPGPFLHLNQLWYGDRVIVHAFGQEYIYEVRQVRQVRPNDTSMVTRHEEYPWLTLLTCRGYDEATNSYRYRVAVRAVLVEVK